MQKHLDSGSAVLLNEVFTDPETSIRYRQYKFKKRPIYRIPFATEEMDKYAYDKAINKKFLGDFIEMDVPADNKVIMIPLDTPEKVKDYNEGDYFKKYRFPDTAKGVTENNSGKSIPRKNIQRTNHSRVTPKHNLTRKRKTAK